MIRNVVNYIYCVRVLYSVLYLLFEFLNFTFDIYFRDASFPQRNNEI